MDRLYQSSLYKKHHWKIVGIISTLLILIGIEFTWITFLSRFLCFVIATIIFITQIVMIAIYEKDTEKRKKEYIEGLRWLVVPIAVILLDIYYDWIYSH